MTNNSFQNEFFDWQRRMLAHFNMGKKEHRDYLDKLADVHPTFHRKKATSSFAVSKSIQESIADRMANYSRRDKSDKSSLGKENLPYARSPYLDDLFSICKASDLTPNDVLLNEPKHRLGIDIYSFFLSIPSSELFIKAAHTNQECFPNLFLPFENDLTKRIIDRATAILGKHLSLPDLTKKKPDGSKKNLQYSARFSPPSNRFNYYTPIIFALPQIKKSPSLDYLSLSDVIFDIRWSYDAGNNQFTSQVAPPIDIYYTFKNIVRATLCLLLLFSSLDVLLDNVIIDPYKKNYDKIGSKIYENYIKPYPTFEKYLYTLFTNSFITLNQYTIIDCSGNIVLGTGKLSDSTKSRGNPSNKNQMLSVPRQNTTQKTLDEKIHDSTPRNL